MSRVGARRGVAVVSIVVCMVVAAACVPNFGIADGPVTYGLLTSESGQVYDHSGDGASVTVSAPLTNTDGNVREAFWQDKTAWYADQQDCVTWNTTANSVYPEDPIQPGLAMRIAPTVDGKGIRAITITQNIVYGATWIFWVDTWDSTDTSGPYSGVQMFDLSSIVGKIFQDPGGQWVSTIVPPPWHVCGRTHGDDFSFMVWTGDNPQPSWTDASHVFTTTLPQGWNYPGHAGGYVGHLRAGQAATFTDDVVEPFCMAPQTESYPDCQAYNATTTTTTPPP